MLDVTAVAQVEVPSGTHPDRTVTAPPLTWRRLRGGASLVAITLAVGAAVAETVSTVVA